MGGKPEAQGEQRASDFPAWMHQELTQRGWRQADFARATGVDVSMISRWMHGRRPDPASLERVAETLGLDLDGLLAMAGYRQRPRNDDPRVATLVAKVRQVEWTPERFLIVDALLEDLRQRSRRIPVEQAALPGLGEV
ncbi:MAG: helix-turn-helix transcriptional regulator [Chloroflexota bacterium]|nr:helix-turn-helix transcriptional regulator [Chloroflexota bacterium]